MPPPELATLHHLAVLWRALGTFDNYGNPTVAEPEEISCNWKYNRRDKNQPKGGTNIVSASVVVSEEIPIGSKLWLGELEDWYGSAGSGGQDDDVMTVTSFDWCQDIRGIETMYTLQLEFDKHEAP